MERKIHQLVQESPEWHQFRLEHDGASEAAAMLGLSKKTSRSELLRMKHTGIAKEFSDWVQTNILDYGHEVEALARPLVEEIIGETLYPATYSYGLLSASCDGITMAGDIAFEHKQPSRELAEIVARDELPEEHQPQCQQVLMVTGAEKLIFTVSDGTRENMVWVEVLPDAAWFKRIEAGWAQFRADLEAYQPPEIIPAAVAAPIKDLPAVVLTVSGALTIQTNFAVWGVELRDFIARIPEKPTTDQEFADCKAAIAAFKTAEAQLDSEENRVLSLVPDIDEMKREKKLLRDLSSTTRLIIEKLVAKRDQEVKIEIMAEGRSAISAHMLALTKRIGIPMPDVPADFAAAIKGKKLYSSMRDAVANLIAAKKIESNEIADKIQINLATIESACTQSSTDYHFLFRDYAALVMKAPDDLALVIKTRIEDEAKRQREENERILEAERQKIRAEEEKKAQAKVKAEADEAERQRLAAIAANQPPITLPAPATRSTKPATQPPTALFPASPPDIEPQAVVAATGTVISSAWQTARDRVVTQIDNLTVTQLGLVENYIIGLTKKARAVA